MCHLFYIYDNLNSMISINLWRVYHGTQTEKKTGAVSPSPLSGQEMPFFKVKFEPAFNDFTVPVTMSKKRGSESRY
jgi:hypothetical protein